MKNSHLLIRKALVVSGTICLFAGSYAQSPTRPGHQPLPLKVVGTKVIDSGGRTVLLRGVNAASMEWSATGEDGHILTTVNEAIHNWHVNIIRLPLAQDRWFGVSPEQKDKGVAYQALVRKVVDTVNSQGCYILLDLHWNDCGIWGNQIGQHVMPDMNSVTFWRDIAREYRNEPGVLFDLYNEPHDVPWDTWLKGGIVTDRGQRGGRPKVYQTPGMQGLLNAVRSVGANNVLVCGGLDWAYDMSGILANRQLSDPYGNGVIYANHTYPIKGDTMKKWMAKMDVAVKKIPVIVSEFGAQGNRGNPADRGQTAVDWNNFTLYYIYKHHLNFTAWDLHPAAGPTLVSNWQYTPTPTFGAIVKKALNTGVPPTVNQAKPAGTKP